MRTIVTGIGGGVKFSHHSLWQWVQCGKLIFCFSQSRLYYKALDYENEIKRARNTMLETTSVGV